MSTVNQSHVEVRNGKTYVAGTGFKVRFLAEEHLAGADATELQANYPQLTLGQIYSALGYYYDHKEEFDREIAELDQLYPTRPAKRHLRIAES